MRRTGWFLLAAALAASLGAGFVLHFLQRGVAVPADGTAAGERQSDNLRSYFQCVQSAAWTDGGKTIVTAAWRVDERKNRAADAAIEIRRWDSETGGLKSSLDIAHPSAVRCLLSADGGLIAVLDGAGLTLYSSTSGKKLQRLEGEQHGAQFSPQGNRLAVFRSTTLDVFDVGSGKLLRTISHVTEVSAASFDAQGEHLLSASALSVFIDGPDPDAFPEGDVKWTRIEGDDEPLELPDPRKPAFSGGVKAVAVSTDGKQGAIALSGGVRFFGLPKGGVAADIAPIVDETSRIDGVTPDEPPLIHRVALSPDGRLLAMACHYRWGGEPSDHQVQLFEIASGKHVGTLRGHRDLIHTLQFSSDSGLLLAAGSRVQLWRLQDREQKPLEVRRRHAIQGHRFFLRSLAFSPDGKTLASAALEGTVKLWDVKTGELKQTLDSNQRVDPQYEVTQVAFLPDGDQLVFAGGSQTEYGDAWTYDWRRDKLLHRLHGHEEPVESIALSADGLRLVTASYDHKAILWDLNTREQLQTIADLDTPVTDITVAISPDASLLITRFVPAKLWDLPAGRLLHKLSGDPTDCGFGGDPYAIDFSPGGKTFATGDDQGTISLWDAATGKRIAGTHWNLWTVKEVLFSPDGRLLAASAAGRVAIFDASLPWRHSLSLGSPLANLPGHKDHVWALAFTRDGRLLATGDQSGLIQIWEIRAP